MIVKQKAFAITNAWEFRQFKQICAKNGIVASYPKKNDIKFPHYQMIYYIGNIIYSLYNDSLTGTPKSVVELGFIPFPFSAFKTNTEIIKIGDGDVCE